MKKTKATIFFIVFISATLRISAQRTVVNLVAKMDVRPQYELWDGNEVMLMGFTKLFGTPLSLPSPTLVFNEGDSVEIKLRNMSQSAPHTIHLHGLDVDQKTDGVPNLSFSVPHDSTGSYIFKAPHAGTYLYHCHVISTIHVQAGMYGVIIVNPPDGSNTTWEGGYAYDSENTWMMSELDSFWHQYNYIHMEGQHEHTNGTPILDYNPQYFLINGKSEKQLKGPDNSIISKIDETVYLRLVNIGYYGNRISLPEGLNAKVISSDGRPLPAAYDTDTLEMYPGERYGLLLQPSEVFEDSIQITYFDLNTQISKSIQQMPVKVSEVNGLNTGLVSKGLNIYPNPFKNEVYISTNNLHSYILTVSSMNGAEIMQLEVSDHLELQKLDMADLSAGIYILNINTEASSQNFRIIKN
ncbi:multicopper oxidase domain-containing protein [Bacteroidia bacterium]|nr:multicopper oxidase domain-containing protein [Bacteroidia bacterium]MDB9882214.1 multicopper oxidase domain-containing protein [Bacteroidia bacterium]MDC1395842.1 multicopper oxidase domain-containing protein [Bacteroidia bacterium]